MKKLAPSVWLRTHMQSHTDPLPLAPLQEIMLRDSVTFPNGGYHIEQVEIIIKRNLTTSRVARAWADTVAVTEALRLGFRFPNGIHAVAHVAQNFPGIEIQNHPPDCFDSWLESDRCREILFPERVPWRMVFWPNQRRLVWTFHHALLDGRSIARVLDSLLTRLSGRSARILPQSRWQPPSVESMNLANRYLRSIPATLTTVKFPGDLSPKQQSIHHLGTSYLASLEQQAKRLETTAATLVTWSWGQAMAAYLKSDAVLVEQVRAGAPQPDTAGFTMNVLPIVIRRSGPECIAEFHHHLRSLRQIESVSPRDFDVGIFPDVDAPGVSMIMVEHSTLAHAAAHPEMVESIMHHERKSDALMATAHLYPELRLEVEGPNRHELLELWTSVLDKISQGEW